MIIAKLRFVAKVALLVANLALPAFAQEPTAAERAAAIKATLAKSQTVLRQYEWLETTVVSLNGEEQSRKQQRCYFGADGQVRKEPVKLPDPPKVRAAFGTDSGGNEKARKEKAMMVEYLEEAEKLIHQYIPLNQSGIEAANEQGKLAYQLVEAGKRGRLTIRDFLKSGDSLELDIDPVSNHPLLLSIASYLNFEVEPVNFAVSFGSLDGATVYTSETVLDIRRRNLKVTVENSGHRKKITGVLPD